MSVLTLTYGARQLDDRQVLGDRFSVRPHALFGFIKSSCSAEKMEKVGIKGIKCLFAVLRSPGGVLRWGGIPAE